MRHGAREVQPLARLIANALSVSGPFTISGVAVEVSYASFVTSRLATLLTALPDRAVARAFLTDRLRNLGPSNLAAGLDSVIENAACGHRCERAAMTAVTSWVTHLLAASDLEGLSSLSHAATRGGHRFAEATFADSPPRKALLKRGKLAEASLPVFMSLSGIPPYRTTMFDDLAAYRSHVSWLLANPAMRAFAVRMIREGARLHHDPVFIGRLLEQRWISLPDVVRIASRRPSTSAIVLTIATRDRWLSYANVRDALAENPFTPAPIALTLLVTARDRLLREISSSGQVSPEMVRAATLFSSVHRSRGLVSDSVSSQ